MSMQNKDEIVPGADAEGEGNVAQSAEIREEKIKSPEAQTEEVATDTSVTEAEKEEPEQQEEETAEDIQEQAQEEINEPENAEDKADALEVLPETEMEDAAAPEEAAQEKTEEQTGEKTEESESEEEEVSVQAVQARSFGKIWLLQMADILNILYILGAAIFFVLGGVTEGVLLGAVWVLRTLFSSAVLCKAEKLLAKEGVDAAELYQKTEADRKLYKGVYIATACIFAVAGTLLGLYIYFYGFDYTSVSACIGFLILTCPTEILRFVKLCRAERKKMLAEGGSIYCPGARAIRDAEYVILRESDVISDKLKFAKIDTYYKTFGTKDSVIGRDKPVFRTILEMAVQATEIKADENGLYKGSGVELAFVNIAAEQGVYKETLDEKFKRQFIFRSKKAVTFGVQIPGGVRLISKGNASDILSMCDRVLGDGEIHPLSEEITKDITERAEAYRKEGAHVWALSFSDYPEKPKKDTKDKMFLGLLVSYYMPNTAGIAMIKKYESAGLKPLLLSREDSEKTAAMLKLYKEDAVCIIKACATEENINDTTAYCNMTETKEKEVLSVYRNAKKSVLLFTQNKENAHLCADTDASVLVGSRKNMSAYGACLRYKSDIFDLRKCLSGYLYSEDKTISFLMVAKACLLVFGLLFSGIFFACPLQFYQMFFLSLWIPVCALHIMHAPYRKERGQLSARTKGWLIVAYSGLAFLVLAIAFLFGRYTIPATSRDAAGIFASAMCFLVAGGMILLLAIQSISHKILLRFSFVASKQAWVCILICAIITAALFGVSELRMLVAIPAMPYTKSIWIGIFLLVFAVASDLIKYVVYAMKEKE